MRKSKRREVDGKLPDSAFRLAIESAFDHVIITDPGGKILYANRSVERTTGYSREEVIGAHPSFWGKQMPLDFYHKP